LHDDSPFGSPLTRAQRGWILAALLSLGLMARLVALHSPLFDHHAWRQADGAIMARNFYRDGLAPLHPRTDARGSGPDGRVATGLELHALVFAAVARVTGFAPQVGRAISALCFPFSAMLLWGFMRVRYGDWHGLFAVCIYALGLPLVLYAERAVWNEPFLILLSLAALRAAQMYLARPRPLPLAALLVSVCLIAAIKPQWLIVLAPIAALWIEAEGARAARRLALWVVGISAIAVAAGTMWHIRTVAAQPGAIDFGSANKLFNAADMTGHYVYVILRRLIRDILGPLGVLAWLIGIAASLRRRRLAEAAAFAGFLVYLVAVSRGNRAHDYYVLAVVPGALIALPAGVFTMAAALSRAVRGRLGLTPARAAAAIAWTMCLFCFGRSISFHSWYSVDVDKEYFCSALRPALRPDDLVVFANYNSPDLLYCLDRRGWLLLEEASTAPYLAHLTAQGASVLVAPVPVPPELSADRPPLVSTQRWVSYRLK
jgi:hypothetical protein